MAQTHAGAILSAARKLGISPAEYEANVAAGLKRCYCCREWKALGEFTSDRTRHDGLAARCSRCGRVKIRKSTKGRESAFKGHKHTAEARAAMSAAKKGRMGHLHNRLGKRHTAETRAKIAEVTRQRTARGPNHYAFSHGRAQRNLCDRRTVEYKQWRDAVFARDHYICQKCGDDRGGNLRAHHVKPFASFPELRFDVGNGITLCHDCHELEHFKPDSTRNLRKAKRGKALF